MTSQVFQCPTCGAPLLPKRSAAILRCPYCRSSVAVPETLRQSLSSEAWTTLLFDAFSANENSWLVGSEPTKYFTTLDRAIADGRYRWEAQVGLPSSIAPSWLMGYPVGDFHLLASAKHIRGSKAGSSWGVIFRIQNNQNCYCFRIADTQFFAVSIQEGGRWSQLVDWERADAIKPSGVNQIEVIAQEAHFTFLINGKVVRELEDRRFGRGQVGLAIEGYTAGEAIAFDFLDITLRAP